MFLTIFLSEKDLEIIGKQAQQFGITRYALVKQVLKNHVENPAVFVPSCKVKVLQAQRKT